jgi:adenine-specific DNA-methyltransferase
MGGDKNALILDFMAGSGTTGQAVLELNKEDGGNRQFILCTNNENNICTEVCYPRIKKVIEGYKNLKGEQVEGLGGNLKYFKTDFVDAEPTDRNKIKLTKQATEMLCIKEGTFELVQDKDSFKIFKNSNHYTGIIFDQSAIPVFKKAIEDIKGKFSVYVFSLSDETFDEEFSDIKQKVKLSPIPEAILRVYRRIFR